MNILLTNSCNRKCPYCFAQERISYLGADHDGKAPKKAPGSISRKDFLTAVEFAKRSGEERVGLLGGEPSLHPDFIALLREAWAMKIQTSIFTNGTWKKEVIDSFLSSLDKDHGKANIIVNVNHPDDTPAKEQEAQAYLFTRLGRYCTLSFNIYREDFDPLFLVDIINTYQCDRQIRLGIAEPLAHHASQHVEVTRYKELAPTIMKLAESCDANDISLGFDCGFLLCMFTAEELGRLHLAGARYNFGCGPVLDVGTDLSVWACFPLSTFAKGAHLLEFENCAQLLDHFRAQFKRLYRAGALPECIDCRHRKRKKCAGGCAAHVYRSFNP